MSAIRTTFGVDRVLLPVVHPITEEKARASIALAAEIGCRGIWLINQGLGEKDVIELAAEAQQEHGLWVGVNLLGYDPWWALRRSCHSMWFTPDGLWSDNAGIEEHLPDDEQDYAATFNNEREDWKGLFFGGVAFKYTRSIADCDLERAAQLGSRFVDVVTTSGDATGVAAPVAKVAAMRRGIGPSGCLALASGVTLENVGDYLPYVDAYLVGTGIEKEFGVLDSDKMRALKERIESYRSDVV